MTDHGKALRARRFMPGRRAVLVPMDHGFSNGPIAGLEDPTAAVRATVAGGATGVVVHKGLVRHVAGALGDAALLVHLSGSTTLNPDPDDKRLVGTVEECVALGADAVSIHVNVGSAKESAMIQDAGAVSGACSRLGMPLLAMMYPRGHEIRDPHDVEVVRHVARVGAELGADLVKCPYTGDAVSFAEVVRSCPVPVVISGGPKAASEEAVLDMVAGAMEAGAVGVSLGRNAFQAADPAAAVRRIARLVMDHARPIPLEKRR